jgi:hypothetical protein
MSTQKPIAFLEITRWFDRRLVYAGNWGKRDRLRLRATQWVMLLS